MDIDTYPWAQTLASGRNTVADGPIDTYPLSPMQLGIVADSPLAGGPSLDAIQVDCVLEPGLDVDILAAAWQRAADRHDALRTAFRIDGDGEVRQELYPLMPFPITVVTGDWDSFLRADRARGFRVDRLPLVRGAVRRESDAVRFLLTFHHSVLDGRSLLLLLREVFATYDALRDGTVPDLPPAVPYRAFIDWLSTRNGTAERDFWRATLADLPGPTLIAGDRGEASGVRHAEHDRRLTEELSEGLREVARECGCTLNTVMQAAWAVLLGRCLGREDVVFGAVRSVRRDTVPGSDTMIGLMLNTLPVRARVGASSTVRELLVALRGQAVGVRDHQHASLMEIQRDATAAGERLFDTLVVYENFLLDAALRAQGDAWTDRRFRVLRQPNYPLVLQVFAERAVLLKLLHDESRFPAGSVAGYAEHLHEILTAIAANPDRPLADLAALPPGQVARAVIRPAAGRGHPDLSTVVAERATAAPDAVAVDAGMHEVSWSELDRWAWRVAGALGAAGCVTGTVVALHAESAPGTAAGLIGILRTGAACLLLDPETPPERRVELADRAGATMLLAGSDATGAWPARLAVVSADAAPDVPVLPSVIRATAAAVLLDAAGADSPPAPVVLARSVLADLGGRAAALPGLTPADVVAWRAVGPTAWLLEVCAALFSGAVLCSATARMRGATVAFAGGADVAELGVWAAAHGSRLRAAVVAGRDRVRLPFPVHCLAGPVEAGYPVNGTTSTHTSESTVGAYTVDDLGRLTPAGHTGRLCLTGAGLAIGYAGDPAHTADRFRPDPFGDRPGARVFLDDEVARVTPKGDLELAASPADAVRAEPNVADAAVTTVDGRRVAVVVPAPGATIVPAVLLRRTRATSTGRQSIGGVVVVPRLPRTGAGGVDADALVGLAAAAPPVDDHPDDRMVCGRIAAIWAEVLGCGPDEERELATGDRDFFELGGHSLFAVSAALRVSEAFGVEIPARWIFDAPTVPEFAARLT
ncbi:condensation domain-containing protein [Micromonospora sp. NPDC051196]|uniref:condensation domain-containing protein n=1 Tax=Micromonospora sp. NPDC051196 TaxID=3155281 RepID=UPI003416391F